MADDAAAAELKRKRTFRKFTYRGVDLDQLLDLTHEQLMELFPCRIRRRMAKGLKVYLLHFIHLKKLKWYIFTSFPIALGGVKINVIKL